MVTTVMLRQLPGLATLGLLTALLAHEAVFGESHVAGGAYHVALILTAVAGSGSLMLIAALAAIGSSRLAEGSVVASALRPILPSAPALLGSATTWFALIERIEPRHEGSPVAPIALALILATLIVAALARGVIAQIARVVLRFTQPVHRRRARFVQYWFAPPPSARAVAFAYRRFARPPPRW